MSVLILAEDVDATADQVVRALTDREVVVYRVNTAWFPAQLSMSTELRGGRWAGSLRTPARVVDLESVTAVWYRTPRAYQFPIGLSAAERLHANLEAKYGLGGVLTSLGALWVNHPARLADAAYKPVQLVTAHRCGLAVPDSVITNDADTVRAFAASGKTITKILGANTVLEDGVRKVAFTRLIGDTDLADLQGIDVTTHFFQRWVPKAYEARMIVIGDHITTAAIRAGTAEGYIDWRADYEGLSYDLVDPPTDVLAGVRELMPALGLRRRHRNPPDPATRRPPRERHPVTDTGTRTDAAWTARAERLAALLTKQGDLSDDAWRAAVAAVPRHLLVPTAYRQDTTTGAWRQIDTRSDEGLDLAYSPETLITALDGRSGYQVPVSSSTKPDLMVRMLQILDVHDGHRVLEIGTGTGYNAALLTHRLGNANVFSVDIDAELIDAARGRLARIGYRPTLVAVDGVSGLPEHAPYDRIIVTCSVPTVPWAWAEQLAPDAHLLLDLKIGNAAGNLVDLRRLPDRSARVEGRFTARWATFMTMRHDLSHDHRTPLQNRSRATDPTERTTTTPPQPWSNQRIVWFLAQFGLPHGVQIGMRLDPDTRRPTAVTLSAPDGSWTTIELDEHQGAYRVTEAGPTPLWAAVEQAHHQWIAFGEPDWPRFGVTATSGRQWIWLDEPKNPIATLSR